MTATATTTGVTIARSELARALRAAASIKSKALHIDLNGEHVRVTGYTGDVAVSVTLDAAVPMPSGAIFVPRALLAGVLAYSGHEITLDVDAKAETLKVTSAESEYELRAMWLGTPAKKRRGHRQPAVPAQKVDGEYGHDLSAKALPAGSFEAPVLSETLRRALPFASRDMTRPILTSIALYPTANCAAATDSYRLAVVRWGDEGEHSDPILLTLDGAVSLQRLLTKKLGTVEITATESHYLLAFEDTRWSLRKIHGAYPDWRQLMPDGPFRSTMKFDRDDLLAASRAAGVVATRNAPLRLQTKETGAVITTVGQDAGKMTRRLLSSEVTGEDFEIGLNPSFVADICAAAPAERLTMKLLAPLRPVLVEAARDLYLLMPIRLNV